MVLILLIASRNDASTKMPIYQPPLSIWVLSSTMLLMLGSLIDPP